MDILYRLPFPYNVCGKIFMYACKSPHTGLGGAMLKKIVGLPFYKEYCINKRGKEFGVNYCKRNIVELNSCHWRNEKKANFDIARLYMLPKLIWLYLNKTSVYGDIVHLNLLTNLIEIDLSHTDVSGDIIHLKSLHNLTDIHLCDTDVTGNIVHLKSLLNLVLIDLDNTGVIGDILYLKSLPNLDIISFKNTGVLVENESTFHVHRERVGLHECEVFFD